MMGKVLIVWAYVRPGPAVAYSDYDDLNKSLLLKHIDLLYKLNLLHGDV